MPRKKSNQHHFVYLPSVKLYYDDLQIIFNFIKDCCKDIKVTDKTHEFDSIDDLKEKYPDKINELRIEGHTPYITVEFKRELPAIYISANENNENQITAFYQIVDFLKKKKSVINYIFSPFILIIASVLFLLLAFEFIKNISITPDFKILSFASLLFCFIILILSRLGLFYSISLAKSNEPKHFLARKKDDILLLIFGGIIGSAITWLISYLTR